MKLEKSAKVDTVEVPLTGLSMNQKTLSKITIALLLTSLLALSSCGGGSGSSNTTGSSATTPNTTWTPQTMIINGQTISYKFGEGNPSEVALKPEQYLANGINFGLDYMTPKIENSILSMLKNPALSYIINNCKISESIIGGELLNSKNLDINNIITINQQTGRKELDIKLIDSLFEAARTILGQNRNHSMYDWNSTLKGCVPIEMNQNLDSLLLDLDAITLYDKVDRKSF